MAESIVRQQYDHLAQIYDRRWSYYLSQTLRFLKAWAAIPADARVLDVACGTGEFERLLLEEQPQQAIVGVDISESMLAVARQKLVTYPNVHFKSGSAAALPFPDASFDWVITANAFHYFDDPVRALAEMRRVLKPQGSLVILDWCKDFWVCRLCDVLLSWFDRGHQHCYTQQELHNFLAIARLPIQASTRFRLGLVWGLMAVKATIDDRAPIQNPVQG